MSANAIEMPRYQCHKVVHALQIAKCQVDVERNVAVLEFTDTTYASRVVDLKVVARYVPKFGDYFVVYDDGYESISPKAAFDHGYTRI